MKSYPESAQIPVERDKKDWTLLKVAFLCNFAQVQFQSCRSLTWILWKSFFLPCLILEERPFEVLEAHQQANVVLEYFAAPGQQPGRESQNCWPGKCMLWCRSTSAIESVGFKCEEEYWNKCTWHQLQSLWKNNERIHRLCVLALSFHWRYSNEAVPINWGAARSSLHLFSRHLERGLPRFRVGDRRLSFRPAFWWKLLSRRRPPSARHWAARNNSHKLDHEGKARAQIFYELRLV